MPWCQIPNATHSSQFVIRFQSGFLLFMDDYLFLDYLDLDYLLLDYLDLDYLFPDYLFLDYLDLDYLFLDYLDLDYLFLDYLDLDYLFRLNKLMLPITVL